MFTFKWIRAMAVLSLTWLLVFPTFGQASGAGYDRMDGNFIKPSKRAQPKRNFNLATQERASGETTRRIVERRSATSADRASASREDDREESRAAKERKVPERFRQTETDGGHSPEVTEVAPLEAGEAVKSDKGYETTEASDVVEKKAAPPVPRPAPIDENQLVYCSKRLLEFHWDAACSMLKNVKPTRLTYKLAKEGRYVECIYCKPKR